MWEFILIWILCGILAFRIDCRMKEQYEYEEEGFSGFFMILLLGGFSLILGVICAVSNKLEDWQEQIFVSHKKETVRIYCRQRTKTQKRGG